ncbi:hypothetical protein [Salegentibacter chungangensis]|uniref:TonB-dependent receptor n=1 Tax=Salegentibacter chungangensis TaxID=1335724 RepID=A0ABW3NUT8_9FLAO
MRKLLALIPLLFTVFTALGQEKELRGEIRGDSLQAPVHIINLEKKTGTVSSDSGEFNIKADEGDRLLFSSVQFKKTELVVTAEMIENGILEVELVPGINELDEVRLHNLTGNLSVDIGDIEVVENPFLRMNLSLGPIPPGENEVKNDAVIASKGQMASGGNILGLVGMITGNSNFGSLSSAKNKNVFTKRDANKLLRSRFDNSFFEDYLKIEAVYINDFIDYAFENGLTPGLLDNEKALDLIAFLEEQSREFLQEREKESKPS